MRKLKKRNSKQVLYCSLGNKLGKLACKQEEPGVCSSGFIVALVRQLQTQLLLITTTLKVHNYIANL